MVIDSRRQTAGWSHVLSLHESRKSNIPRGRCS